MYNESQLGKRERENWSEYQTDYKALGIFPRISFWGAQRNKAVRFGLVWVPHFGLRLRFGLNFVLAQKQKKGRKRVLNLFECSIVGHNLKLLGLIRWLVFVKVLVRNTYLKNYSMHLVNINCYGFKVKLIWSYTYMMKTYR